MKFKFPLDIVLKERKVRRDEAERDYRIALSKLEDQRLKLEKMRARLKSVRNEMQSACESGGHLSGTLVSMAEFVEGQKIRLQSEFQVLKSLEEIAEGRKRILVEAQKELKTLEKLREKRYTEFKTRMRKKENELMDEISITRFSRGQAE